MILHAFYNVTAAGDYLLCRSNNDKTVKFDTIGDVTYLFNHKEQVIGLNINNASLHFDNLDNGKCNLNTKKVNKINELIAGNFNVVVEEDQKERLVVGQIVEFEDHPESDHLHICKVDIGTSIEQIVCGATNAHLNQKVVVATIGTMMPNGLYIEPSTLKKVASNGMLCSARELGLTTDLERKGIITLDDSYIIGESFLKQHKEGKSWV